MPRHSLAADAASGAVAVPLSGSRSSDGDLAATRCDGDSAGSRRDGITIRSLMPRDVSAVIAIMRRASETAFLDWENRRLLMEHVGERSSASFVAYDGEDIVGAVIAGSFGVRGTISHIAVVESHRRRGVGSGLVREALVALRRIGVKRIFLFAARSNSAAEAMWRRCGFAERDDEATWECDI